LGPFGLVEVLLAG